MAVLDTAATDAYALLRRGAGLLERAERGKLLLRGSEAAEFLQGQLTNDVESLGSGEGCYAALLTHKGKLRTDMRLLRGDDWIWADTEPAGLAPLIRTCEVYSLGRDVSWEDVSTARVILSVIGPRSAATLELEPPDREHAWVAGEHGLYVRTDQGVDVICEAAQAPAVRGALGVASVPEEAAECVRIESGRPRFGLDFDEETMPQEAGLNERAVSFTKGCYVGQETVARLHYKGKPNRHLRGLTLAGPAEHGEQVQFGDRVVGKIGSACASPAHGHIALAVLRREAEPGAKVRVGDAGLAGEVVALPFTPA